MTVPAARPPPLAVIAAIAISGHLAVHLFVPSLPILGRDLGASKEAVQWTLTLYFFGLAAGQLVYGPLSDVLGRRPIVLWGLAIYALASFGGFLAGSIEVLIPARLAQAVGACAGMIASRAIIQDVYGRDRGAAALSVVLTVSAVSMMTGPVIGGYLAEWFGWRAIFLMLAGLSVLLLLVCLRRLPETLPRRQAAPPSTRFFGGYEIVLRNPVFLVYGIGASIVPTTHYGFMAGAPHFGATLLGLSPGQYGLMTMVLPVGYILGNVIGGRSFRRFDGQRKILLGNAISALALIIALSLATWQPLSAASFFLPMALLTFGHGLSMLNMITITLGSLPHLAGTAAALIGSLQMISAAVLSSIVGLLLSSPPAAMLAVLALAHALGMWIFSRRAGSA